MLVLMKNHSELLLATPSTCQSRNLLIHVLNLIRIFNEKLSLPFLYSVVLIVLRFLATLCRFFVKGKLQKTGIGLEIFHR